MNPKLGELEEKLKHFEQALNAECPQFHFREGEKAREENKLMRL